MCRRSITPSAANTRSGHAASTSSASGKRSRRRNCARRVDHVRGASPDPAPAAERGGVLDSAEDDQPWRGAGARRRTAEFARLAQLAALGQNQLLGRLRGVLVLVRGAQRSLARAVRRHEQLRADRRDAGRAHNGHDAPRGRPRARSRESSRSAHCRYSSTNTSISPRTGARHPMLRRRRAAMRRRRCAAAERVARADRRRRSMGCRLPCGGIDAVP